MPPRPRSAPTRPRRSPGSRALVPWLANRIVELPIGLFSASIAVVIFPALATAFAYWCLPQLFFYGLYSLLGEVLNARSAFGPFMWAPVLNNIVAIAGLVGYSAFESVITI